MPSERFVCLSLFVWNGTNCSLSPDRPSSPPADCPTMSQLHSAIPTSSRRCCLSWTMILSVSVWPHPRRLTSKPNLVHRRATAPIYSRTQSSSCYHSCFTLHYILDHPSGMLLLLLLLFSLLFSWVSLVLVLL